MAKTNTGLASFAVGCLGRPYIYGTYGQILTERLLQTKAMQYPSRLSDKRVAYARAHYIGKRVSDCEGLIKNYLWADSPNEAPVYNSKQDLSANGAFEAATVKGKIGTIPEIPGICVRYNGHVGVYIGGGYVVEARGFDFGCVKTKLNERGWTDWFEHPWIQYNTQPTPQPTPEVKYVTIEMPVLRKGDKSQAVKTMQACLDVYGYGLSIDGSFGGKSAAALLDFQKKHPSCGTPDSICGKKTWDALLK